MRILITQFQSAAARFAISRAVIVAMLLGPILGATLAVAAQDATNVVTIDNFTFTPPELTVAVGTTVKWVNHDDIPHLVVNKGQRRHLRLLLCSASAYGRKSHRQMTANP